MVRPQLVAQVHQLRFRQAWQVCGMGKRALAPVAKTGGRGRSAQRPTARSQGGSAGRAASAGEGVRASKQARGDRGGQCECCKTEPADLRMAMLAANPRNGQQMEQWGCHPMSGITCL